MPDIPIVTFEFETVTFYISQVISVVHNFVSLTRWVQKRHSLLFSLEHRYILSWIWEQNFVCLCIFREFIRLSKESITQGKFKDPIKISDFTFIILWPPLYIYQRKRVFLVKICTIVYTILINAKLGLSWGHVTSRQSDALENSIYV